MVPLCVKWVGVGFVGGQGRGGVGEIGGGMFLSFVCDHSSIHSLTHPINQSSFNLLLLFCYFFVLFGILQWRPFLVYLFESLYLNCYFECFYSLL